MSKIDLDSPRLRMVRTPQGLAPCSPHDDERLSEYSIGSEIEVRLFQRRSDDHHKLYWVILGEIANNNEKGFTTAEGIHWALKMDLGYIKPHERFDGTIISVPSSTAKSVMDQAAFAIYFDKAMQLLEKVFGIDVQTLIEEGKKKAHIRSGRNRATTKLPTTETKRIVQQGQTTRR